MVEARSTKVAARLAFIIAVMLAAGGAGGQSRSDAAREKRWADQIISNLVVGDALYLEASNGTRFLALYASSGQARAAVLLVHGPGLHPDHGITGELRVHLVDQGYATLSLQMPVLPPDAEAGEAYRELFPEAVQRVAAGARLLEDKGFKRYAIVSHAMGSGMAYEFLKRSPHAPITAWAALSFYGNFPDIARRSFPVLDIYGRNDYRGIRGAATERRAVLDTIPGSRQLAAQQGGRFLAGAESTVLKEVADFLDAVPR